MRPSGRLLILDLSAVTSADAAGLAVLIGIRRRAAGLGITLRLAAPARRSPRCSAPPGSTARSSSCPLGQSAPGSPHERMNARAPSTREAM
ncbi:STAS domain-containing protein [Actinomadura luteofluorescens]|uniref:STAS domain-containing protein n=1 Tax=Actinomadura luteofluorescens TaxID=46163 RepID=UPI003474E2DC